LQIIDINDTNTKIKIGNKIKQLIVANSKSFNQSENLSDDNIPQNQDLNFNQTEKVPITRACQKLIVYRNASQLALLFLEEEMNEEII
jgi:hypothetical protein